MILGITGKKGSGKDYIANLLLQNFKDHKIVHFADPLKTQLATLLNIHPNYLFSNLKNKCYYDFDTLKITNTPTSNSKSLREILQIYGTDMVRDHFDSNYWVNLLFSKYNHNIIIPDVRFKSEAEAILSKGGEILRVVNTEIPSLDNHISETEMDNIVEDYTIVNNLACNEILIEQLKKFNLWGRQ